MIQKSFGSHKTHRKAVGLVTDPFLREKVGRGEMKFNQMTPGLDYSAVAIVRD